MLGKNFVTKYGTEERPILRVRAAELNSSSLWVTICSANASSAAVLIGWCNTVRVETVFIDSGSPWQNGFAEPFTA